LYNSACCIIIFISRVYGYGFDLHEYRLLANISF
jgi:hypothetical protein